MRLRAACHPGDPSLLLSPVGDWPRELLRTCARNPSDNRQKSVRSAPGIDQMCTRNIASLLPFDPPLDSKSFFKSSCMAAKAVSILLLLEAIPLNSKEVVTILNYIVHLIAHLIICISLSIYLIFERAAWRLIMCLLVGFSKGFEPVRLVRRTQAKVTCLPYLTLNHGFYKIFVVRVLEIFVLFTNSM